MKIDRIRGGVLGVVACGAMLGCGAQTGDGGDASAQEQVRVIHYRHGSELLEAKFRGDPQAPELLDGPDNDRLQQLMSEPTSGLATDPSDENLFWIYDNDAEGRRARDRASESYRRPGLAIETEWPPGRMNDWAQLLKR